MGIYVTPINCDDIRQVIDLSLDATILPDATIASPLYMGQANAEIDRRDPLASTRTSDQLQHYTNAAILLTAALVCPMVPQPTMEQFGGTQAYRVQREAWDWHEAQKRLRAEADVEISYVLADGDPSAERPTAFTVGSVWRHRRWA